MGTNIHHVKEKLESGNFPFSFKVLNVDREYKSLYKSLINILISKNIGMTKERNRGLIWFWKRKNSG